MRGSRRARFLALAAGLLAPLLPLLAHAAAPVATERTERTAPRLEARSLEGKRVSLEELLTHGPVLIDFWATWCKPCITSLPSLERLWQAHRAEGLTVVAISIDGPRNFAKVRPFARGLGLTFPVVLDEDGSLTRRFEVTGVPTSILIGPDGRVVRHHVGYTPGQEVELEAAVAQLLHANAAADSAR